MSGCVQTFDLYYVYGYVFAKLKFQQKYNKTEWENTEKRRQFISKCFCFCSFSIEGDSFEVIIIVNVNPKQILYSWVYTEGMYSCVFVHFMLLCSAFPPQEVIKHI